MTECFSLLRGQQVLRFAFTHLGNCLAALLVSVLSNSSARAWGAEGHQVIATLAEQQLTPAARKEVDRLLALEPGQTLASISTWADEHRNPQTAGWHYINFPRGTCTYEAPRDCPDGKCVVEAINRQVEVLTSNAPDEVRLTALKYLVHLVGDVHQPLHAGYKDDRGGNTYQLQAFMRGSNLHAVWDSGLIKSLNEDTETLARRLATKPVRAGSTWSASSAAQDSCQIVSTPGFYPERLVTTDYVAKYAPVMEDRLVEAGARLAQVLNRVGH
jgi:hypothetical protein